MAQTSNFDTPQHLQEVEERLLEEKWRPLLETTYKIKSTSVAHRRDIQKVHNMEEIKRFLLKRFTAAVIRE